jgi:hypothetical protein
MLSLVAAIPHIVVEFGIVISLSSCVNVCSSGKYMKTIDVHYPPWDIAIIPKAHRAVVTFTQKIVQMQFINLQTFTQDDKLRFFDFVTLLQYSISHCTI